MVNPIKKLAGQTAIYGLSSIVGRFLNYLLTPLWTGLFSAEQFGIITELYAYVAFLVVLLTYGMETAYFRYATKKGNEGDGVFSTVLISVFSTSLLFIAMCYVFSQSIADWLMYPNHTEYIVWFSIIVGLDALTSIPLARLRLQSKAMRFAAVNFVNIGVNIGLNWFFLIYCKGAYESGNPSDFVRWCYNPEIGVGYVFIANLIASIAKFISVIPSAWLQKWTFDRVNYKRMIRYAMPLLLVGLAGIINETLDRILLKRMLVGEIGLTATMQQLGIYGANYKLSIIITLFIQAFRYAAEPFFFQQEKVKNSGEIYAKVMHYFVIVLSVMFLFVLYYLDIFKYFINNEELWVGLKIVPILLLANICLGVYINLSIWYKLSEKTGYGAIISIFGALVTIALNVLLIPFFGYVGSAWATLVCYGSMVVVSYILGQKHYPVPYKVKSAMLYVGGAVGFYFLSVLIKDWNNGQTQYLLNSVLLVAFVVLIYFNEAKGEVKA